MMALFHRLSMESWYGLVAAAALTLIATSFIYFVVRALFMSKKQADHMSNLPLEKEKPRKENGSENGQSH